MTNSILNLIANDGFICVNKNVIKKLGLNCAVLLGELASQYNYWSNNNKVDKDGYFYLTAETCENNTGLSYYELSKAIDKLKDYNILFTKTCGMPAKRYFKISIENLINLLNSNIKNLNTSIEENEKQDFKNLNTCFENFKSNNNIDNNINNNIDNSTLDDNSSKEIENFLISNKKDTYKALDNKIKKEKDPDNTKSYKNLVEFISNLRYNQSTIDNLLLWYKNVGVGKVSIKQLKDKIIKLHEAKLTEQQISEAFYKAYMNGWFAFYTPNSSYNNKTNKENNVMYQESIKASEDTLARNEDGSLVEY